MAEEVHDITSAQQGLSSNLPVRQRRYLISMVIRTGFFVAAVFLPSPYRWFCVVAALVLPYIAVVMANAGRENVAPGSAVIREKRRSIS
jgi:predicted tellurium resistance membrane protein TerC